jgi:hypothetical protein
VLARLPCLAVKLEARMRAVEALGMEAEICVLLHKSGEAHKKDKAMKRNKKSRGVHDERP